MFYFIVFYSIQYIRGQYDFARFYFIVFYSIQYIRSGRVTSVAMASDGSRMVWGRWKGDTVWTPRVCADARETNDALATGSWGPETGGSVPMGGCLHYSDVILGAMAPQITSPTIVYSTVCLGVNQKHPCHWP